MASNFADEARTPTRPVPTGTPPPVLLSGQEAILAAQPRLQAFADACGQKGAADYVQYFLTQPYTGGKRPHLLLFERHEDGGSMLEGAVLVHQYRMLGMPLSIYVTEDIGGERNILGAQAVRGTLAVRAARYLVEARGAHTVVLSLQDRVPVPMDAPHGDGLQWAGRRRTLLRRLPLLGDYQATLATLGAHTRRNFRLFRRRAIASHGCSFVPRVEIAEQDFLALNARCAYPVPANVAEWRYRSVHSAPGGVLAGVRTADGDWISMVGGRRSHGSFAIDWQMNRTDYARISPATLLRGYLIEHEAAAGTRSLLFQGGTPHSMQSAFQPEHVVDLVASSRSLPSFLLRRLATRMHRPDNFLLQTLAAEDLR